MLTTVSAIETAVYTSSNMNQVSNLLLKQIINLVLDGDLKIIFIAEANPKLLI